MSDERRTALITGAASGIGRAAAERLLRADWRVAIADLNAETGEATTAELAANRGEGRVTFVRADVADEADVEVAVAHALESHGRLDCLVNNAGFSGAFGPITELEADDWDATFAVLCRGVFLGIKHGARAMQGAGGGSIVNVSSIAGLAAGIGSQAYSTAKAGVINLTRVAAVELAPERIRVNAVSPGIVMTPLVSKVKGLEERLLDVQPWPEYPQAEHVAEAIEFLASPRSQLVSGANLVVDGATMAAGPRLSSEIGSDPGMHGMVGISRGNSGQRSHLRRRPGAEPPSGAVEEGG